jgi:hypothetical protein
MKISVAKDFSKFPAGRFHRDGPFPGEKFRALLVEALKSSPSLTVELDGTMGYGSSFLEEAFGGLVRVEGFKREELVSRLKLESEDKSIIDEVWEYINDAKPE